MKAEKFVSTGRMGKGRLGGYERKTVSSKQAVKTHKEFPGVEWVAGAGEFIKVDSQKCTGCEDCVKGCLAECFELADGIAKVKTLDMCLECGYCWFICPADAVEFSLPPSGTGFRSEWG